MTNEQPTALLAKLSEIERGWVTECNICTIDETETYGALCGGHAARLEQDNAEAMVQPEPEAPAGDVGDPPLDVNMGLHYARLAIEHEMQTDQATQFTHTAGALVFAAQALRNLEQLGIRLTAWAEKQPDRIVPRQVNPDIPVKVAGFDPNGNLVVFVPLPADPTQNGSASS